MWNLVKMTLSPGVARRIKTKNARTVLTAMAAAAIDPGQGDKPPCLYFAGWGPLALSLGYDVSSEEDLAPAAKRAVARAVAELKCAGLIVTERSRRVTQTYRLVLDPWESKVTAVVTPEETPLVTPEGTTAVTPERTPLVTPGGQPLSVEGDTPCHPEEEEEEGEAAAARDLAAAADAEDYTGEPQIEHPSRHSSRSLVQPARAAAGDGKGMGSASEVQNRGRRTGASLSGFASRVKALAPAEFERLVELHRSPSLAMVALRPHLPAGVEPHDLIEAQWLDALAAALVASGSDAAATA